MNGVRAFQPAGITTEYEAQSNCRLAKVSKDWVNFRGDPNRIVRSRVGIAEMRAEQRKVGGPTPGMGQEDSSEPNEKSIIFNV
jgi:hypothetical protein